MSVGPMGMAGSVAGSLPQLRAAETERSQQDAADTARRGQSARQAEDAAGVGQTEQDEQVSDRDADGRRLWETPPERQEPGAAGEVASSESKDPTGERGSRLDLSG